ncbi:MAG: hypothetical protein DMF56_20765 [Acidobacteria bacterium]|nr:MAG: hypothetical protein DMF56_20765 [Acidobacteriota bacterium]
MKKLALALLFASTLVAQPLHAQTIVKQVNDRRSNGSFSSLSITMELPNIKSTDVAASRVLVSNAVDDAGGNLLNTEGGEPQLQPNSRGMYSDNPGPLTVDVDLKNPSRKSTSLKSVSGQIELFMPSKDSNSVAEIPKFTSFSGKTLSHKAFKANNVEISLVSEAQLEAERKKLTEAKTKELKESGYDDETLKSVLSSYTDYLLKFDEGDVVLRVKDEGKHIQDIAYIDAKGEVKRASINDKDGYTVLSTWGEKPEADWKLRVNMKTAKNIVRVPFSLTNVPLP